MYSFILLARNWRELEFLAVVSFRENEEEEEEEESSARNIFMER